MQARRWIGLMVVVLLLVPAVPADAQCGFSTLMSTGATFITVFKQLTSPTMAVCTRIVNDAFTCNPVGPTSTTGLFASAKTATAMTMFVSCAWTCSCDTQPIRINSFDGLPVELLDFSVGGEERSALDAPLSEGPRPPDLGADGGRLHATPRSE